MRPEEIDFVGVAMWLALGAVFVSVPHCIYKGVEAEYQYKAAVENCQQSKVKI